jgi:vacuolar-type H+-ATPase subunit E/Vma4
MAIEDILRALEEQAQAECEEIRTEASEHAEHIVREGEQEAERIRAAHARQAEQDASKRSTRTLNTARLEAKARVSKIKGTALEGVFQRASEQLGAVRGSPEYPRLFKRLAEEALADIDTDAKVHVDAADVDLARRVVSEIGVSAEVLGDVTSAGGLVVELDEGRIMRRNTFEDRLSRARSSLQADVAKALVS